MDPFNVLPKTGVEVAEGRVTQTEWSTHHPSSLPPVPSVGLLFPYRFTGAQDMRLACLLVSPRARLRVSRSNPRIR